MSDLTANASNISLVRCQSKNQLLAICALHRIDKSICINDYDFTRALLESQGSALPSVAAIKAELPDKSDFHTE